MQASTAALALFEAGQHEAASRGLLLVDTKYEFGKAPDGSIRLVDEIHTPDSSRFSDALTTRPCRAILVSGTWLFTTRNRRASIWPLIKITTTPAINFVSPFISHCIPWTGKLAYAHIGVSCLLTRTWLTVQVLGG